MDQPLDSSNWYDHNASDEGVNSQHSFNQLGTFSDALPTTTLDWNQSSFPLDWMFDSMPATDSRNGSIPPSTYLNIPTGIDGFDAVQEVDPLRAPPYPVVNLDITYNPGQNLNNLPAVQKQQSNSVGDSSPTAVSALFDINDASRTKNVYNDPMVNPVFLEAAVSRAVLASQHGSVSKKRKAEVIDQKFGHRTPQHYLCHVGQIPTARASNSSFGSSYNPTILEETDPPGPAIDACCLWLSNHPRQVPSMEVILGIHLAFDASRESLQNWFKRHCRRGSSQYQMADSDVTAPYRVNRNKCNKWAGSSRASRASITIHRDEQRPYTCTSRCGATFKTKDDWRKHEEINYPQKLWYCHLPGCVSGSLAQRVSFRKEHFTTHLAKAHGLRDIAGNDIDANCLPIASRFSRRCLFQDCSEVLDTWKTRIDHLAKHFVKPWDVSEWRNLENDAMYFSDDEEDRNTARIINLGDPNGQCSTKQLHGDFNDNIGSGFRAGLAHSSDISAIYELGLGSCFSSDGSGSNSEVTLYKKPRSHPNQGSRRFNYMAPSRSSRDNIPQQQSLFDLSIDMPPVSIDLPSSAHIDAPLSSPDCLQQWPSLMPTEIAFPRSLSLGSRLIDSENRADQSESCSGQVATINNGLARYTQTGFRYGSASSGKVPRRDGDWAYAYTRAAPSAAGMKFPTTWRYCNPGRQPACGSGHSHFHNLRPRNILIANYGTIRDSRCHSEIDFQSNFVPADPYGPKWPKSDCCFAHTLALPWNDGYASFSVLLQRR